MAAIFCNAFLPSFGKRKLLQFYQWITLEADVIALCEHNEQLKERINARHDQLDIEFACRIIFREINTGVFWELSFYMPLDVYETRGCSLCERSRFEQLQAGFWLVLLYFGWHFIPRKTNIKE